ncbi:hypothetical protein RDABS01_010701 [Bienertia sinuspersici]
MNLKPLKEETAKRIEEAIHKNVEEKLNLEEVKIEIERCIKEGQKKLVDDVTAQLKKEKETNLMEARQKEKEEAARRKKLEEEEERANQILLAKNKA